MSLAKETIFYGATTILARLINYILVPLHTSIFTQAQDYGIISEVYALAVFGNVLYLYGMETAYFYFATKKKKSEKQIFQIVETTLVISTVLFSALFIYFVQDFAALLNYQNQTRYFLYFIGILSIDTLVAIPFARLRLQKKKLLFGKIKLTNVVINIALNFFFLWFCKGIYEGSFLSEFRSTISLFYQTDALIDYVFLSNLIANATLPFFLWKVFSDFRWRWETEKIKQILGYSFPLLIGGIAFSINEVLDRLLIKYHLPIGFYEGITSTEALGIYSACYKLSIFISLGVQAYRYAAEPFFFSRYRDQDSQQMFALAMKYFIIICAGLFLAICVHLDLLSLILRESVYRKGIEVVPYLLMANVFLGIYFNLSIWYKVKEKTKVGAYLSLFGAAITIIANYILIPELGYLGSAVATFCCYFSMALVSYFLGKRHYPIPYHLRNAAFYLAISVGLYAASEQVYSENQFLNFLLKSGFILIFLSVVFFKEKTELKAMISKSKK